MLPGCDLLRQEKLTEEKFIVHNLRITFFINHCQIKSYFRLIFLVKFSTSMHTDTTDA
jgi:hypothetical protein